MKKLLILIVLIITGCNKADYYEGQIFNFNTLTNIKISAVNGKDDEAVYEMMINEIERINKNINNHSKGSELDKINSNAGNFVEVSNETIFLLKEAKKLSKLTVGKYDVTIKPVFDLWGFGDDSIETIPDRQKILRELEKVEYRDISIKGNEVKIAKGQEIELASFLKGYAIYMGRKGVEDDLQSGIISSLSSTEVIGRKIDGTKWRIGVQNPDAPNKFLGVLELENMSVAVSGDYQTYIEVEGQKYHHILDAITGFPSTYNKMVVVLADNSFITDMYSTALFVMKSDKILEIVNNIDGMECMIVDSSSNLFYSKNFEDYFKFVEDFG